MGSSMNRRSTLLSRSSLRSVASLFLWSPPRAGNGWQWRPFLALHCSRRLCQRPPGWWRGPVTSTKPQLRPRTRPSFGYMHPSPARLNEKTTKLGRVHNTALKSGISWSATTYIPQWSITATPYVFLKLRTVKHDGMINMCKVSCK